MYQDPRYPQLPMTQADWSGLLKGFQQAQPQVQAAVIPDNAYVARPPVTVGSATPSPAPPVAIQPQAGSPQMDQAMNDASMYPLAAGQSNNYPGSNPTPPAYFPQNVAMPLQSGLSQNASVTPGNLTNFNGHQVIQGGQDNRVPGSSGHPYAFFPPTVQAPITPTNPLVTALLKNSGATGSW